MPSPARIFAIALTSPDFDTVLGREPVGRYALGKPIG